MMDAPDTTTLRTKRHSVSFGAHALGLLQVTHPLPSALYVLAVAIFSTLAASVHHHLPDGGMLARALIGVACAQIAVGSLNDYRDRASDALHQPDKPIARGVIAPWEALALVALATIVNVTLMATLGLASLVLGLLIEGLGV
ncbi:MAG: UbiA family prenyltransferase, partial [Ktedonobacterales bacterium]